MISRFIREDKESALKLEVISFDLKILLARTIEAMAGERFGIHYQNRVVNLVRVLAGRDPIQLDVDDTFNDYQPWEYTWHEGEFYGCIIRLDTMQFVGFVVQCVTNDWVSFEETNQVLVKGNAGFSIVIEGTSDYEIKILSEDEFEVLQNDFNISFDAAAHPNIRLLAIRMDGCLEKKDSSGVLAAAASIFETLAKEVLDRPSVENQFFGGFFAAYKKKTGIADQIADYMLSIYNRRNTEPLAGHGSLDEPSVTLDDAKALAAFTKTIVVIEKANLSSEKEFRRIHSKANSQN